MRRVAAVAVALAAFALAQCTSDVGLLFGVGGASASGGASATSSQSSAGGHPVAGGGAALGGGGATASGGASTSGDGGASVGGGGEGGHGGAATTCPWDEAGNPCTAAADCCSGECHADHHTCAAPVACSPLGVACSFASACCSLGCVDANDAGRSCTPLACATSGATCARGSDCCSGVCVSAACVPRTGCAPAGEACAGDTDCCGNACRPDLVGVKRCILLAACRAAGEQCSAGTDCCSSACSIDASDGLTRCAPIAGCQALDGTICTLQAGEPCDADPDCCTRACRPSGDGPKRCAELGGCRQTCQRCASDADCCSGLCDQDAAGVPRCTPITRMGCLPTGELCGGPCCPDMTAKCAPEQGPPNRCHAPPADAGRLGDGARCKLGSECASALCIPDATGALSCAPACSPEGARCGSAFDCCDSPTHDCLPVGGVEVCIPR